jgi:malonyl CoA-acyl carrier protein transacylase
MISGAGITHIIEFGPGGVLSKLMKRIDKSIERVEVSDAESAKKAQSEFSA